MKKHFILMAMLAILMGCAGTDNKIVTEQPLADIYKTAYEEFNEENYEEAAIEFLKAETQYPSSPWAPDALVMAAYSHYMDNDFAGAILATDRFMRFHPGHKDVPYIMYLRGMCYYRQVSDVRREPGMSAYALQQFQTLVQRFPRSEYAKNAENKITVEEAKENIKKAGYKPYYLYRQKNMVSGLDNVGYFKDNKICHFNIDTMDELSSIVACGANAISKRVFSISNRIERFANVKDIKEYVTRVDEMLLKKKALFEQKGF